MFTRRTHDLGAIIGVLVGFVAAYFFNTAEVSIHWSALSTLVVASCMISGYLASLIIPW